MLAAARMDLSRLAGAHADDAALREQVTRVDQILEAVIQNARSEMQRLHPALLDHFGLSAALRHLVEQACRAGGAEYTFELPDFADARVSAPMALAAYRAVEALLEAGSLTRVTVTLREGASQVQLHVDVERTSPPPAGTNNDLLALRAWLEALGAGWSESERGTSTALDLSLPLEGATATPAS
jgi:signal transduction histidine kinase